MESVGWDKKYREGFYDGATEAHAFLRRFWRRMPDGLVLDIAMGNGRDGLFLATKGHQVCGLDRSWEAVKIARAGSTQTGYRMLLVQGDAESLPFKHGSVEAVVIFYFLSRAIMGELAALLRKGGVLLYETFLKRQNSIDGFRNPEYLLDDGELISHFRGLETLFYEEILSEKEGKRRAIARYVGRKP